MPISSKDMICSLAIPFREAGMLVADGNGHITSGKDDFAIGYF